MPVTGSEVLVFSPLVIGFLSSPIGFQVLSSTIRYSRLLVLTAVKNFSFLLFPARFLPPSFTGGGSGLPLGFPHLCSKKGSVFLSAAEVPS